MGNWNRWDIALLVAVCVIAIAALVRLMRNTRDRLLAQMEDDVESKQGPRRLRDRIDRRNRDEAA